MSIVDIINGSLGLSTMASDYTPDAEITQEDFLNLLVTQLKNQNPWEPLSNEEYISQLTQFSQLEQTRNMNANLSILQMYQASLNNVQAVSLIGMTIMVDGDTLTLKDGEVNSSIMYDLDEDGYVTIDIYDEDGKKVATKEIGGQSAGEHEFNWDGTDDEGNTLTDGEYTFKVSMENEEGDETEVSTYIKGKITGVSFRDNITYLMVGGKEYPLSAIKEILDSYQSPGEGESEGEA